MQKKPPQFAEPALQAPTFEPSIITNNQTMHEKNIKEIEEIKTRIEEIKRRLEIHENVFKQARNCIYKLHNGETLIDLLPEFNQHVLADLT